ncbi:transcription factor [Fusarium longipes]|uniref:Protein ZIP4 homolog n=1 Tax=Fusarium longipes TaxID=694270 RepID=A0A395RVR3_9HYPO|nr:transcription factor [Fusarium longipes]
MASANVFTASQIRKLEAIIAPPAEIAVRLRDIGRRLWNECIKERRKRDDILSSSWRIQLRARARVLSFLIHVLARETRKYKDGGLIEDITSMMEMSLTLARVCIESSDLDGALLSMTKAAGYIDRLKMTDCTTTEDQEHVQRIEAEYFAMRCALSWKQGCLDVAEHMYKKSETLMQHIDSMSSERLADTFHCIGSELASKEDHDMALKWLQRALNLINAPGPERLSTEGLDLRISIYHELIQALLATNSEENLKEADNLASLVESEIGDKPIVLHWKLEIIQRSPGELSDTNACASILRRMIRSLPLSDLGLGFLLHSIGELRTRGPRLAIGLMEDLIIKKLIPCGNMDWMGKAIVRRVWMGTMEADTSVGVEDLVRLLDQLTKEVGQCNVETSTAALSASHFLLYALMCAIRLIHLIETPQDEYTEDIPELAEDSCLLFERDDDADIRLMAARCHFVVAAALISQARTEDNLDEQLQQYLEARYHILEFDTFFNDHVRNDPRSSIYPDLLMKMSRLFVFDFESAVCLKSWDDLSQIVRKATICKDERIYKAMADCLLRSEASGNVLYRTMRLIINEIYLLEEFDNKRLAKYLRCLFKAILPLDDGLALQVTEQAAKLAREGSQVQTPFPADDLDYIVATTFNHAIDISTRGDEVLCQQWVLKALELAEYMDDGGDMRNILRERAVEMGLSREAVVQNCT